MSKEILHVGIVGAGANTVSKHIPGLQAIDGVQIISVCNRSRQSSQRIADKFGIPNIYDEWWQLIAAPDTQAIVIGTWPYLHCPATLAALEAGKHVMVEARMAMDATEARKMLEAAEANPHLVAQIVPSPFSFGVDATIQRLISKGYLGEILAIEIRDHAGEFLDQGSPIHWRQDGELSGLNVMSLGIWYETLMRWVGEATSVTAMGKTFVKMRPRRESGKMKAVHTPEHLNVTADMACGAQATFSISTVTGLAPVQEAVLYGSAGTLRFTNNKIYGGQRGDQSLHAIAIPDDEIGYWRVEEEFVNTIRGLEDIRFTPFETGLKYMIFTEAVAQSMATGKTIDLGSIN
jgi:predicted dehydrogenase